MIDAEVALAVLDLGRPEDDVDDDVSDIKASQDYLRGSLMLRGN